MFLIMTPKLITSQVQLLMIRQIQRNSQETFFRSTSCYRKPMLFWSDIINDYPDT